MMWACYLGEISEEYRNNWTPHAIRPDKKEPDVFDVLATQREIMYRLDEVTAGECFTDEIQVDWGGWAYKATKKQAIQYNEKVQRSWYRIPQDAIDSMEDDETYGIIEVEIY